MSHGKIVGVGLIVACGDDVLMLTELKDKPWLGKQKGMRSFPMETCKKSESPRETLNRLQVEELPGVNVEIDEEPAGTYQVMSGIWLQVWWATSKNRDLPTANHDGDVAEHSWDSLDKARHSWLRTGAGEALKHYEAGRKKVSCAYCNITTQSEEIGSTSRC